MLHELSLFSGYAGATLGLRLAGLEVRTVGYCEIEPYCQELLRARIQDGLLDWAPIITDITSADFRPMAGLVDIITAGFPCQAHSKAGRRDLARGLPDDRDRWPDTLRVLREVGPRYILLENVRGLADGDNPYAAEIIGQLSQEGYDSVFNVCSASQTGAPHLRERWFCLAYSHSDSERPVHKKAGQHPAEGPHQSLSDAGTVGSTVSNTQDGWFLGSGPWWGHEPNICRVVDGDPFRVERIKALGNGIVPAVVKCFLQGGI